MMSLLNPLPLLIPSPIGYLFREWSEADFPKLLSWFREIVPHSRNNKLDSCIGFLNGFGISAFLHYSFSDK